MGVGTGAKAWRLMDINKDYTVRSLNPMRVAMFIRNGSASLSPLSSSYVRHPRHVLSCRQELAIRHSNMVSSTAARAVYQPLRTCTGQTSCAPPRFSNISCADLYLSP